MFLSSCSLTMTDKEAFEYYKTQSTYKMCMKILTVPHNIYNEFRVGEISRRGENCSQYEEMARAQREQEADKKSRSSGRTVCNKVGYIMICNTY